MTPRSFNLTNYHKLLFSNHPDVETRKMEVDAANSWFREYRNYVAEERQSREKYSQVYKKTPSNSQFAANDQNFIAACESAGVRPTARQASKFRNKKGAAWIGGRNG